MNEELIQTSELGLLAKEPFFLMLSLMCKCNLFNYMRHSFEEMDEFTRPGDEAFVLHAWYCDLWVSNHHDLLLVLTHVSCRNRTRLIPRSLVLLLCIRL